MKKITVTDEKTSIFIRLLKKAETDIPFSYLCNSSVKEL